MKNELTPKEFLAKAMYKKNIWDFCGNFYKTYLQDNSSEEKKLQNFIMLLEWNGESDETVEINELFSNEDYQKTSSNIFPVVKKIIENLVIENLDEKSFYKELLKKISDDVLFANELEKICAFVILFLEPRIPYFKLGQALKMDNEKYIEISNSIHNNISKAFFALQFGYSQKTELASQLYNIVKEQETEEERIVLIANILGYYNSQIKMLYDKLKPDTSNDDNEE